MDELTPKNRFRWVRRKKSQVVGGEYAGGGAYGCELELQQLWVGGSVCAGKSAIEQWQAVPIEED